MNEHSLSFPEDYAADAPIWESKGFYCEACLLAGGRSYRLFFYEPVRLAQDIAADLGHCGAFFEPNLVVVAAVNREQMERAARWLVETRQLTELKPEADGP
ncbi:hypothetical protein [Lysobacter enzymogenes]|uniref:Uncharacterized protein n=1 Tax=Lysobacter enzymogenes TaxID=69 RepID=A0A3N2RCV6_LYSEN|nr:hypothetical protein [Lysobacter enzymogenes]ROU05206.1 hypothetical protein D9T17_20525 [Lysobacter enzymogenes]